MARAGGRRDQQPGRQEAGQRGGRQRDDQSRVFAEQQAVRVIGCASRCSSVPRSCSPAIAPAPISTATSGDNSRHSSSTSPSSGRTPGCARPDVLSSPVAVAARPSAAEQQRHSRSASGYLIASRSSFRTIGRKRPARARRRSEPAGGRPPRETRGRGAPRAKRCRGRGRVR